MGNSVSAAHGVPWQCIYLSSGDNVKFQSNIFSKNCSNYIEIW